MLTPLKPQVYLRDKNIRTVMDAVITTQIDFSGLSEPETLLSYLRGSSPVEAAGVVTTQEAKTPGAHDAMRSLGQKVVQAAIGLGILKASPESSQASSPILMSMRGAQPHTDLPTYKWKDKLFWALCLHDTDTDLLFGNLEHRIAMNAGALVIFDPCQPHALVAREHLIFKKSHFPKQRMQFFVGGEFTPDNWEALGVSHSLSEKDMVARRNIHGVLVHQETCQVKRRSPYQGNLYD